VDPPVVHRILGDWIELVLLDADIAQLSLTWRAASVQPAPAENSPAESVVGSAVGRPL
jgi:hypothetical protein